MKPTRLDELRDIILGPDAARVEELAERIEDIDQRSLDVAEVLPESLAASARKDTRLISSLRAPVRQCVTESVREDPESYANALFPIMGPAIRRSVGEALRAWFERANRVLDQGLSLRGLAWRVEAWRAGIPYGEYVLQQTLVYRVDHVYLIHSASGLLVGHVLQGDATARDDDAIAAMFTAIQDFVTDSFREDQPQRLRTAELGELSLWAVHGPNCSIAAVVRGVPPAALRARLETALERIEAEHGHRLSEYSGDPGVAADVEPLLRPCLLLSLRDPDAAPGRRLSPAKVVFGLLLAALLGWFVYGLWLDHKLGRFAEALGVTPGIVVADVDRRGRHALVRGLRDPLATTPGEIAAETGWDYDLTDELRPFISLEPAMVLARAASVLAPPPSVDLAFDGGVLVATGTATPEWADRARRSAAGIAGVDTLDLSGLAGVDTIDLSGLAGVDTIDLSGLAEDQAGLLARIRARLEPPAGITLALRDGTLKLEGEAGKAWLDTVAARRSDFPQIRSVDTSSVEVMERLRMTAIERVLEDATLQFAQGSTALTATGREQARSLGRQIADYADNARVFGLRPGVTVIGHSDAVGPANLNERYERDRARGVADEFMAVGVAPAWVTAVSQLESGREGVRSPGVTLRVEAVPADAD